MSVLSDDWSRRLDKWFATREKGDFTFQVKGPDGGGNVEIKSHWFLIEDYLESEGSNVRPSPFVIQGFLEHTVLDFVKLAYGKFVGEGLKGLLALWNFCVQYGTEMARNKVWDLVDRIMVHQVTSAFEDGEWEEFVSAIKRGNGEQADRMKDFFAKRLKDSILKPLKTLFEEPKANSMTKEAVIQPSSSSTQNPMISTPSPVGNQSIQKTTFDDLIRTTGMAGTEIPVSEVSSSEPNQSQVQKSSPQSTLEEGQVPGKKVVSDSRKSDSEYVPLFEIDDNEESDGRSYHEVSTFDIVDDDEEDNEVVFCSIFKPEKEEVPDNFSEQEDENENEDFNNATGGSSISENEETERSDVREDVELNQTSNAVLPDSTNKAGSALHTETGQSEEIDGHVWVKLEHIKGTESRPCCSPIDPNKWERIVRAQKPGVTIHLPEGSLSFPTDYNFCAPRLTITGASAEEGNKGTTLCWHPKAKEIHICKIGPETSFQALSIRALYPLKNGWPVILMEGDHGRVQDLSLYGCGLYIDSRACQAENVTVFGDPEGKPLSSASTNAHSFGVRMRRKSSERVDAGQNLVRNVSVRDTSFGVYKEFPCTGTLKHHFSDRIESVRCQNVKFGLTLNDCVGDSVQGIKYSWEDPVYAANRPEEMPAAVKFIGGQKNQVKGVFCSGAGNYVGTSWVKKGTIKNVGIPAENSVEIVEAEKISNLVGFSSLGTNKVVKGKKGAAPSIQEPNGAQERKRKQPDSETSQATRSKKSKTSVSPGILDEKGEGVWLDIKDLSSNENGCCHIIDTEKWDAIIRAVRPGITIHLPSGKFSFPDAFCILAPGASISGQGPEETLICWHPKEFSPNKNENVILCLYESISFQNLTIKSSVKLDKGWPYLHIWQNNCKVKNVNLLGCGLWISSRANLVENVQIFGGLNGELLNTRPGNMKSYGLRLQPAEEWISDPGPNRIKGVKVRDTWFGVYKAFNPTIKTIKDRLSDEIKHVETSNVFYGLTLQTCSKTLVKGLKYRWDGVIDPQQSLKLLPTAVQCLGAMDNLVDGVACTGVEGLRVAAFKKHKEKGQGRKIHVPEKNVVRNVTGADGVLDEGPKGSNRLVNVDEMFQMV